MTVGAVEALRRISARSLTLLLSRVELATVELAQARALLVRWQLLSLACSALFQLAAAAATAALAALLWERVGPITLVAAAVVYAGIGVAVLARMQREIAQAPPLLAATLAELAKDRDAIFVGTTPAQSGPPGKAGHEDDARRTTARAEANQVERAG